MDDVAQHKRHRSTRSAYANEDNHDLIFAYLLHFTHQVDLPYTLFLPAGTVLRKTAKKESSSFSWHVLQRQFTKIRSTSTTETNKEERGHDQDYAVTAINWYQQHAKQWHPHRICYINLIEDDDNIHHHARYRYPNSPPVALWLETREHALRMSVLLQSFLPYHQKSASKLLSQHYCQEYFIWNATLPDEAPALFTSTNPEVLPPLAGSRSKQEAALWAAIPTLPPHGSYPRNRGTR